MGFDGNYRVRRGRRIRRRRRRIGSGGGGRRRWRRGGTLFLDFEVVGWDGGGGVGVACRFTVTWINGTRGRLWNLMIEASKEIEIGRDLLNMLSLGWKESLGCGNQEYSMFLHQIRPLSLYHTWFAAHAWKSVSKLFMLPEYCGFIYP